MAISFIECINRAVKAGQLDRKDGNRLIEDYQKFTNAKKAKGAKIDSGEADAEFLDSRRLKAQRRKRNLQQHAIKVDQLEEMILASNKDTFREVRKVYQSGAYQGQVNTFQAEKLMDDVADQIGVRWAGLTRDYDLFNDGVRWAIGDTRVTNPEAVKVGKAIRRVYDHLYAKYTSAGGIMGRLDNYFPQVHARDVIRAEGKENWVNFLLRDGVLDLDKMINKDTGIAFASAEELRPILGEVYDDIVFNGRKTTGRGDLDMRHSASRFLFFKDADGFFEYNRRFGFGDKGLAEGFFNSVRNISRDSGVLEVLGPRPNAMKNHLDGLVRERDAKRGVRGVNTNANNLIREFNVLTSRYELGDPDLWQYRWLANAQNVLRATLLGRAFLSAFSDVAFAHATSRVSGLSSFKVMQNLVTNFVPGESQAKRIAKRMGYGMRVLSAEVLTDTRRAGDPIGNNWSAHAARLTNVASGLDRWTRAGKNAVSVEAATSLGDAFKRGLTWEQLGKDNRWLQDSLESFGIKKKDWEFAAEKAKLGQDEGVDLFVPIEFRSQKFASVAETTKGIEVADKFARWVEDLRQKTTNEATLQTRSFTTGFGAPGTPQRAVATSLGLFKTFPITVINTHLVPAFRRIADPARRGSGLEHLFNSVVYAGILGVGVIQLKDVTIGKTPREMSKELMIAGLLQGGGLGILGDFVFGGGVSRFGRKPFEDLAGPLAGLVTDSLDTLSEIPDFLKGESNTFGRSAFNIVKRNLVPSTWYTRLVGERLFLDHLERLFDPKYDDRLRKYERNMIRRKGQEFWWRPGEIAPR